MNFVKTLLFLSFILSSFFIYKSLCDVSGRVFRDYNYDGDQDTDYEPGLYGVYVHVQFEDDTEVSVETDEFGDFSVSVADGEYVRLYVDAPYFLSQGTQAGSTTTSPAFVHAPASGVMMGFAANTDFCGTTNPEVVIPCYVQGDQNSASNANLATVVKFNYDFGTDDVNVNVGNAFNPDPPDNEPAKTQLATASQTGTTWATAYARYSDYIFTSSFMKRHSGFTGGDDNTGTIYYMNSDGSTVGSFFDLDALNVATRGASSVHGPDLIFDDEVGWDNVGKVSLGGLDLSPNEEYMFVMNLYDRTVYKIYIGETPTAPTDSSSFESAPVPLDLPGCPSQDDARPFALKYHNGYLWVGLVCSAESSADTEDLQAYVYLLDPMDMSFYSEPVLHEPLNFRRGRLAVGDPVSTRCTTGQAQVPVPGPVSQADWRPWVPVVSENPLGAGKQCGYPQPLLSDIEFGYDGSSMYLGFIDRYGHQSLNVEALGIDTLGEGVSGGDLLCAWFNASSGYWVFENNGVCGDHVSVTREGGSGVGNTDGPGGGEFFADDRFDGPNHQENTLGGIAALNNPASVMSNGFDVSPKGDVRAGGVATFTQEAGTQTRAYVIFTTDENNSFGKAAGLGEPSVLCNVAPLQIGTRFWNDLNGNGIQDAGEPGLDGCTVELVDSTGTTVIATDTTDSNGEVFFDESDGVMARSSYYFRADLSQSCFVDNSLGNLSPLDSGDSDGVDSDGDSSVFSGYVAASVDTGVGGMNDFSVDFGFFEELLTVDLGDFVWSDSNGDGIQDDDEPGLAGIVVMLEIAGTVVDSTVTDSNGLYFFTDVPANTDVVVKVNLEQFDDGYVPSPFMNGSDSDSDSNGDVNVEMGFSAYAFNSGDDDNFSVDFGFVPPMKMDPRVVCADGKAASCDSDDAVELAVYNAVYECGLKCLAYSGCPKSTDPLELVMDYDCSKCYTSKCSSLCPNDGDVYKVDVECVCSCATCDCVLED